MDESMHDPMITPEEAVMRNRESWEKRTAIHLNSPVYQRDISLLREGKDCLTHPVSAEIGDVRGLRIAHLQCHIGTDSFALTHRGGEVTGLDFSLASINAAKALATELGFETEFVVGDAMLADQILPVGAFDRVVATFGITCWIPDMARWMRAAAALLKPGGRLYLCDGHPFINVFKDASGQPRQIEVAYDYFSREAMAVTPGATYADDGRGEVVPGSAQYHHTVGDLVNHALAAGLRLDFFHEFPDAFFRKFQAMRPTSTDGQWEFEGELRDKLPFIFSLGATKG